MYSFPIRYRTIGVVELPPFRPDSSASLEGRAAGLSGQRAHECLAAEAVKTARSLPAICPPFQTLARGNHRRPARGPSAAVHRCSEPDHPGLNCCRLPIARQEVQDSLDRFTSAPGKIQTAHEEPVEPVQGAQFQIANVPAQSFHVAARRFG